MAPSSSFRDAIPSPSTTAQGHHSPATPPNSAQANKFNFLGLTFDKISFSTAASQIQTRAQNFAPFSYVVTPNVDHIVRLETQPELLPYYTNAWLTVCDSKILKGLAKASGTTLEAIPGADLVEALLNNYIAPDDTVLVIGGTADTIKSMRARYALEDIRWHDAPHGLKTNPQARRECADFVANNPAQWVFIAVGSPQQEMIAMEIAQRNDTTGVGICCGASLEFLSGEIQRAPVWMRRSCLEWLHRLASEPKRLWRRYIIDGPKILKIWLRWKRPAK